MGRVLRLSVLIVFLSSRALFASEAELTGGAASAIGATSAIGAALAGGAAAEPVTGGDRRSAVSGSFISNYTAVRIYAVGDEALMMLESPTLPKASVLVSSQVENAILLDEMDDDTGMLVESEFSDRAGAIYELPASKKDLLLALGLPVADADGMAADEDLVELIRVHIETRLALSPPASRLVFEALEVSVPVRGGLAPVKIETDRNSRGDEIELSQPSGPLIRL